MKRRILYTVLDGNMAGGQKVCFNIMKYAEDSGYTAILLSPTDGPFVKFVKRSGIKTYVVPFKKGLFRNIVRFIRIMREEGIDLIHTHGAVRGNIPLRIAALICGRPVISHIHIYNYFGGNLFKRAFVKALDNITARICKRVIAVSKATKKSLMDQGYPESKLEVIYNSIDLEYIAEVFDRASLLKESGIRPDAKIFLHIGRLCPNKGQKDLLEAMRALFRTKNVCCLFAGDDIGYGGRYKVELSDTIKSQKLGEFTSLLGFREDISPLINISDAVVLPSYAEGLPLAAMEAMRSKKPFVGYSTDGIPEIVEDGRNGYLVERGDIKGLTRALTAVLEDPIGAKRMGEEGFKTLKERFSPEIQKKAVLRVYKKEFNL